MNTELVASRHVPLSRIDSRGTPVSSINVWHDTRTVLAVFVV